MKNLYLLYFTLLSITILAQEKTAHLIKIYLEDAETGKNISDAKVTLEGFEIPAITGKYDKTGKYYYFDKIPAGYNTIMAYHVTYNEKGFQNVEGLPNELKLKLYTPYRVRIPSDSVNYYKEDNSRLYVLFNDTILNSTLKCEYASQSLCFAKKYIAEHYPKLIVKDELSFSSYSGNIIIVEKQNKTKFKRFNDPIIKKLVGDKNIITLNGMLLITKNKDRTYFDQEGNPNYISKYLKYINCDTLHIYYSSLYTPTISNEDFKKVEEGKKQLIKKEKTYKDIYLNRCLDYKIKLKNGLLKNNICKRDKKDIDYFSNIEKSRIKEGELINNIGDYNDTLVISCKELKSVSYTSTNWKIRNQYKAVSNILTYDNIGLTPYVNGVFTSRENYIVYYNKTDEDYYKKENSIVETLKINEETSFYRLKNNIASPFGTTDLMEYYNLYKKNIIQKIEKNIEK